MGRICRSTGRPVALELTATPNNPVAPGAEVRLAFLTARATRVKLDSRRDSGRIDVLVDTPNPSGEHRLADVREARLITLRAENPTGIDELKLPISLAGDGPRIWSFETTRATVPAGDSVTLSWQVTGASTIEIRDNEAAPPILETHELTGKTTVSPHRDTTYTLYATSGSTVETARVSVTIQAAPNIVVLDSRIAAPEPALPGDGAVLSWRTANATAIVIRNQAGIFGRVTDPARVRDGAMLLPVRATSTRWEIIAGRADQASPARVEVLAPAPAIQLAALTIEPDRLPVLPPMVGVDIAWDIVGIPSSVEMRSVRSTVGHATSYLGTNIPKRHRLSIPTNVPTEFLLTVTGLQGGTVESRATAWPVSAESVVDHRTPATAQRIDGVSIEGTLAAPAPGRSAEDWYVLAVDARETLRVRFARHSPCPSEVDIHVYDGNNDIPRASRPIAGAGEVRALYVPDLPAGDVLVQLTTRASGLGARPCEYTLYAEPYPATCGNRMIDAGETCDDGNTMPRDGCEPTCADPVPQTYTTLTDRPALPLGPQPVRVTLWQRDDHTLPATDDGVGVVELPFDFPFYGRRHRAVLVWTHGIIQLSGAPNPDSNQANSIALFGANLQFDPADPEAGIFSEVREGSTGPAVEISFRRMRPNGPSGPSSPEVSGSIVLFESGRVELSYPGALPEELGRVFVGIQGNGSGENPYGYPHPMCRAVVCTNPSVLSESRVSFIPDSQGMPQANPCTILSTLNPDPIDPRPGGPRRRPARAPPERGDGR